MKDAFWRTAVTLIVLLLTTAACTSAAEDAASPEISGPAFVLFYTDN